jgi:hypothetical protein
MLVVALVLAALASGSTVAGAATPAPHTSGVRGVVMRGPITPVCSEPEPCEAPASGVVLLFSQGGRLVAKVKTSSAGRYRVTLRPGRYSVTTLSSRRVGTGLTPRFVKVPTGRVVRVDLHLDTGIQ